MVGWVVSDRVLPRRADVLCRWASGSAVTATMVPAVAAHSQIWAISPRKGIPTVKVNAQCLAAIQAQVPRLTLISSSFSPLDSVWPSAARPDRSTARDPISPSSVHHSLELLHTRFPLLSPHTLFARQVFQPTESFRLSTTFLWNLAIVLYCTCSIRSKQNNRLVSHVPEDPISSPAALVYVGRCFEPRSPNPDVGHPHDPGTVNRIMETSFAMSGGSGSGSGGGGGCQSFLTRRATTGQWLILNRNIPDTCDGKIVTTTKLYAQDTLSR